jgi:hypothetical protein
VKILRTVLVNSDVWYLAVICKYRVLSGFYKLEDIYDKITDAFKNDFPIASLFIPTVIIIIIIIIIIIVVVVVVFVVCVKKFVLLCQYTFSWAKFFRYKLKCSYPPM